MKHKIFTVFDVKAQAYLPPFVLPERGMAMRVFSDCVNSKDHQFGLHPGDYTLFELGVWDDSVAVFATVAGMKVCNGLEVVGSDVPVEQGALDIDLEEISNEAA